MYTIKSISRRLKVSDGSNKPIMVVELTNGRNIIREESQFVRDCENSQMTVTEALKDCAGGSVDGDIKWGEKDSTYVLDENSTLVKNGVLNEETGEPYKVGDIAKRQKSGYRVEKYLQLTKNPQKDMMDRIARETAALMQKQLFGSAFGMPAASSAPTANDFLPTAEEEILPAEEEEVVPAIEDAPAPAVEETAPAAEETPAAEPAKATAKGK